MRRAPGMLCAAAVAAVLAVPAWAATIPVTADIDTSTTWTSTNEYVLTQPIYVTNGATLTIEPGTTVRGEAESIAGANDPGALIISRGSKIRALGTVDAPIVFTNLDDDNIGDNPGTPPYDALDTALGINGTWGGLILLGRGYVANNSAGAPNPAREVQIEGLTAAGGLGLYGACSLAAPAIPLNHCDDDDSGTLNFVSIRYGGFNLSPDNEINGLTIGAVGRTTQIDYIEILNNRDDGVELFGGAASIKHLISANVGDDSVDWDEGWRGKMQFVLAMQGAPDPGNGVQGDRYGEHDGGNGGDTSEPRAIPTMYNVTAIGLGAQDPDGDVSDQNLGIMFRDATGGRYYNSFFADFGGAAACLEGGSTTGTDAGTSGARATTAYTPNTGFCSVTTTTACSVNADCPVSQVCVLHFLGPDSDFQLELQDDTFYCFGANEALGATFIPQTQAQGTAWCDSGVTSKFYHDPGIFTNAALDNQYLGCASPLPIRQLDRVSLPGTPDPIVQVDPRPAPGSPLLATNRIPPADGFFDPVSHRGAFDEHTNWAEGWSTLDRLGYFPAAASDKPQVMVNADINVSDTWTADNEYVLTQPIYVTNGATLTIEPCTTVRGEPESVSGANDPGALIVSRGSKIFANGTEDCPVTFTNVEDDNIGTNPGTAPYDSLDTALGINGTWGGLILLGRGYVANNSAGAPNPAREVQIEGLTAAGGLGLYGACSLAAPAIPLDQCDDDDSGALSFVSIRYGGFNLSPDNEINGLTIGAVGRSTDINYVEILNNRDDGVELFGGAASIKHLISANVGDDSVDWDEGWRGKMQFVLAMQGAPDPGNGVQGDRYGEHDGGNGGDTSEPRAIPTMYNVTAIGLGAQDPDGDVSDQNLGIMFRDATGGRYYNSLFADFGGAVACLEGGSTTGTDAGTSGARATTAYTPNTGFCSVTTTTACSQNTDCPGGQVCVLHFLGPDSDFQLELQDNTFYCFGANEALGATFIPQTQAQGTAWCDSGVTSKFYHDPGIFTNAALDNTYLPCAAGMPLSDFARVSLAGTPDPIVRIDPRPAIGASEATAAGELSTNRAAPADGFFEGAPYRGAFREDENWADGWSTLARLGYFSRCSPQSPDAFPNPVRHLTLGGPLGEDNTRLEWKKPLGGSVTGYDVLRSNDPSSFASPTFVALGDPVRYATDADVPVSGAAFYYVVRAENDCGTGSIGASTEGVLRPAP